MEFWGVEVKPGKPLKVPVEDEKVIHLSQASLGEIKKDKATESVPLFVNINGQKLVLGHLNPENIPSQSFDLVFEKEFELSHNSKNGSVYFTGYTSEIPDETGEEFSDFEDSESEDEPLLVPAENEKPDAKVETAKAAAPKAAANKPQAKKDAKPMDVDEDEDDSDDDSDDSDDSEGDEADDDAESEDDSDESDEETPKKPEVSKKRPADSAPKTPVSGKKAKASTPQKTDGKKSGHTATPHPAKKTDKKAGATPKSGGQFSCSPCKKSFGSDTGLQSHNKAKHAAK